MESGELQRRTEARRPACTRTGVWVGRELLAQHGGMAAVGFPN